MQASSQRKRRPIGCVAIWRASSANPLPLSSLYSMMGALMIAAALSAPLQAQNARSDAVRKSAAVPQLTESAVAPSSPPLMRSAQLAQAPAIDGDVLNDPVWRQADAPVATGFWQVQPVEGSPASQRTEVRIGYTDDTLYVGVVCYDTNPDGIIVTDSRRDSSLDETDSFQLIIDSYLDRQNGFVFGTNPAGVQLDGQVTKEGRNSGGFNLNWDTTWEVSSVISDIGWSAELAIPFKSLRYGRAALQNWGINFQRNIRRNNEIAYWSPLPRQYQLERVSQAGTLEALGVPPQRNLKLTPYALGQVSKGGDATGTDFNEEFGVDVKYSLTPSLTLDATVNTDFAQVEADEQQVNLNRFSLFFPEKRPFFLENAGQFSVGVPREIELFFSRRIGIARNGTQLPIDAGVRLTGRIGSNTNVGLLQMRSQGVDDVAPRNDYSVVRINRELRNRSSVGAIFVNRQGNGTGLVDKADDYNRSYAIDGRLGVGENGQLSGFVAKTDTPGRTGKDHAFSLRGAVDTQAWSTSAQYVEVGDDFNPEVGFLARRNFRNAEMFVLHRYRPDDLWGLLELRPHVFQSSFWNFAGEYESGFTHIDNHFEWKSGLEIHTGMNLTHEQVFEPFEIADGVFVQPGNYNHKEIQLVYQTDQSAPLSLDTLMRRGGLFGGDRFSIDATVKYRIGERFSSEASWIYNDIDLAGEDGSFTLNLARLRLSYSFSPKILLQALVQYNEREDVVATNLRFSWLQSANAGLFLVYNEIDDDSPVGPGLGQREKRRELVLKYSRILDLLN